MRRIAVSLVLFAVVLLGALALGRVNPNAVAQDDAAALAAHPVVGSWLLSTPDYPEDPPSLIVFHGDGTYVEVGIDGSVSIGSWEPTGERSVALTIVEQFGTEEEGAYTVTVRAAGEVDASGDALTGTYTLELTLPDGTRTGEHGPGTVAGTRIAVEPMGTPVGTLEELFAQFEEGTPEAATPVP